MTFLQRAVARLWRLGLRLKFVLFQRHRHDREVLEEIGGFSLQVRPGVFNPSLFRVTPIFLEWLSEGLVPAGSRVLDVGTGSGVLAIAAASAGARVVAVDSNPAAVDCARINADVNGVDDRVEIRPAEAYWGMGSLSVEAKLKEDLGEAFQILTIGPAGEKLSRYACINSERG